MGALRATQGGSEFWQMSAETICRLIAEGYTKRHLADEVVERRAERLRARAA